MIIQSYFNRLLFLTFSLFLICAPVSAYIDPGVGSMIWQMAIAGFLGLSYATHLYWIRIKKFIRTKILKEKAMDSE